MEEVGLEGMIKLMILLSRSAQFLMEAISTEVGIIDIRFYPFYILTLARSWTKRQWRELQRGHERT